MKNTKKTIIQLLIAVFLTIAPIAVFNSVWHIIKVYLPLINAVAMILSGSFFIIMYVKGYSWGSLAFRFRNLFIEKQNLKDYMKKRFDPDPLYKSRSVLVTGIILIAGAVFFLNQYRISWASQKEINMMQDLQ
ncbi:hypothetical protein JXA63_05380, partial [Candidatus Woesebacteria bacterium]|nr:hypothetical protein [Candidatus Woesebacteria bacterium]